MNTCSNCKHYINNKCFDTPLHINRSPESKACKYWEKTNITPEWKINFWLGQYYNSFGKERNEAGLNIDGLLYTNKEVIKYMSRNTQDRIANYVKRGVE